MSTLLPGGATARDISVLAWIVLILMCVVIVFMGGLVLYAALRRRGSLTEHEPIDAFSDNRWILYGGVLGPLTIVVLLYVGALVAMRSTPVDPDGAIEIDVTAHQWWWELNYRSGEPQQHFTSANEIHIPVGRPVHLVLRSADVNHSFWVPRLHGKMDLIKGHTNHIVLQADQPGVYEGQCAEYCGAQHSHMRFLVIAQPAADYEKWAALQRQPAVPPSSAEIARGRQIFETHACALCHSIRGTDAAGRVAPDLTHLAGRATIAAGSFANNRANLRAWIVNAQSLKPGTRMPSMSIFDGEELQAIGAYLESLE